MYLIEPHSDNTPYDMTEKEEHLQERADEEIAIIEKIKEKAKILLSAIDDSQFLTDISGYIEDAISDMEYYQKKLENGDYDDDLDESTSEY